MPNFLITEYFVNFVQWGREVANPPIELENGYAASSPQPPAWASTSTRTPSKPTPPPTSPSAPSGSRIDSQDAAEASERDRGRG